MNKIFFLAATIFSTFLLASCKHKQPTPIVSSSAGKFNFGVLRYDSTALEYRLDSIHNRGLVLQFCVTQANDNNSAFQLISYAYDTLSDHNNSWMPDTVRINNNIMPKTFSGKLTIGNNEVTREQLLHTVRDATGKRFSYDYVQFTPVVEGVFHHVVYMIKAIKADKPTAAGQQQMTSPMPPTRVWQ